jgi:hypothetical protein
MARHIIFGRLSISQSLREEGASRSGAKVNQDPPLHEPNPQGWGTRRGLRPTKDSEVASMSIDRSSN